jgi:hypothetical protein
VAELRTELHRKAWTGVLAEVSGNVTGQKTIKLRKFAVSVITKNVIVLATGGQIKM